MNKYGGTGGNWDQPGLTRLTPLKNVIVYFLDLSLKFRSTTDSNLLQLKGRNSLEQGVKFILILEHIKILMYDRGLGLLGKNKGF